MHDIGRNVSRGCDLRGRTEHNAQRDPLTCQGASDLICCFLQKGEIERPDDVTSLASVPAASLDATRGSIHQTRLEAGIVANAAAAEDGNGILPGWALIEDVIGGRAEEIVIRGGCRC